MKSNDKPKNLLRFDKKRYYNNEELPSESIQGLPSEMEYLNDMKTTFTIDLQSEHLLF